MHWHEVFIQELVDSVRIPTANPVRNDISYYSGIDVVDATKLIMRFVPGFLVKDLPALLSSCMNCCSCLAMPLRQS